MSMTTSFVCLEKMEVRNNIRQIPFIGRTEPHQRRKAAWEWSGAESKGHAGKERNWKKMK